jgi:hypothetical protein
MFGREGVAKEHIVVIGCGLAFAVLFSVIRAAYLRASVVRQVTAFCDELSAKDRTRWAGKRILAIVNPHGGRQTAMGAFHALFKPMCEAVGVRLELRETKSAGHAVSIAEDAASEAFELIVALSVRLHITLSDKSRQIAVCGVCGAGHHPLLRREMGWSTRWSRGWLQAAATKGA